MRSVVAAVLHAPESGLQERSSAGVIGRQKADDGARFARDIHAANSGILFRRAHEIAGVPATRTAEIVGVAQQVASRWTSTPLAHPPPLYSVLAHPLVELVVGASLSAQAADALAQAERLDGDPEAIRHAAALLLHAVDVLHATLARRGL